MNLESVPFIYVERKGPFATEAPKAWGDFWSKAEGKFSPKVVIATVGLSRPGESQENESIYQAGVILTAKMHHLPPDLSFRELHPGRFASFLLTGPYEQLGQSYQQIFAHWEKYKFKIRPEFCIENYLNDPKKTNPDELKTAIMIPIQ